MLDREDVEGVRLLLDAGASQGQGPEGSALLHAIGRDRSPAVVRLLLERGADVEAYGPDGRTAYAGAVLNGRDDLVPLLVAAGARPEASAVDAFAGAVVRGDDDAARRVLQAEPGLRERLDARARAAVVAAAMRRGAAGADLLVELGLGVDLPGWSGGTALHQAAWLGLADAVAAFLARGADPRAESGMELSTPLAWAVHGSIHGEGGDHVAVAELLVGAGAEIEPRFPDAANEELAAWLAEAADGRTG
jgi:ankyrin repeat protein